MQILNGLSQLYQKFRTLYQPKSQKSVSLLTEELTPDSSLSVGGNLSSQPNYGIGFSVNTYGAGGGGGGGYNTGTIGIGAGYNNTVIGNNWINTTTLTNTGNISIGNYVYGTPHNTLNGLDSSPKICLSSRIYFGSMSYEAEKPRDYIGILHNTFFQLIVDFYYEKSFQYSSVIMELKDEEMRLSKGRFKNYKHDFDEGKEVEVWTSKSNITPFIEWINDETFGDWTISKIKTNHISFGFTFKFVLPIEAGHFSLRWQ